MDAATVFRVMSLIPDRVARTQSGGAFALEGQSERVALLARFLHWLGPLDALTKEDQQRLGLRAGAPRPVDEELEGLEADEMLEADALSQTEELEQAPMAPPGAGTQIAA